ncbi:MAG: hypothetical protein RLZZ479_1576 [Bacteroidota bacterium]
MNDLNEVQKEIIRFLKNLNSIYPKIENRKIGDIIREKAQLSNR